MPFKTFAGLHPAATLILFLIFAQVNYTFSQVNREVSLNGSWQFQTDPQKTGVKNGFIKGLPSAAKTVTVPHTWNVQKGLENYAGLAWYEKSIDAPAAWKGKAVFIRFAAVYHDAFVYINGKLVGQHLNSGYTPFSFDISSFLTYGQQNKVVVSCDNSYTSTNLPYQTAFDWVNDGGIIRNVSLYVSDRPSINYVHITPEIQLKDSSASMNVSFKLNEDAVTSTTVSVTLNEKKSGKTLLTKKLTLAKAGNTFQFPLQLKKLLHGILITPFYMKYR